MEAQEEFDEVQKELRKKDTGENSSASNLETGQATKTSNTNLLYTMLSHNFIQAFTMTFLAEWSDKIVYNKFELLLLVAWPVS